MITKKGVLKWLEQFDDDAEVDYTVSLVVETSLDVYLLDMDTGKSYTYTGKGGEPTEIDAVSEPEPEPPADVSSEFNELRGRLKAT